MFKKLQNISDQLASRYGTFAIYSPSVLDELENFVFDLYGHTGRCPVSTVKNLFYTFLKILDNLETLEIFRKQLLACSNGRDNWFESIRWFTRQMMFRPLDFPNELRTMRRLNR